jgi:hypothetical protein
MDLISENDQSKFNEEWKILISAKGKRTFDIQLKYSFGGAMQKWILASCDQEFDEDGKLTHVICCMFVLFLSQ